jgi:hypothetical protein
MEAALKFNQQVEAVCRRVEHSEPSSDVKIGSAVTARRPSHPRFTGRGFFTNLQRSVMWKGESSRARHYHRSATPIRGRVAFAKRRSFDFRNSRGRRRNRGLVFGQFGGGCERT